MIEVAMQKESWGGWAVILFRYRPPPTNITELRWKAAEVFEFRKMSDQARIDAGNIDDHHIVVESGGEIKFIFEKYSDALLLKMGLA